MVTCLEYVHLTLALAFDAVAFHGVLPLSSPKCKHPKRPGHSRRIIAAPRSAKRDFEHGKRPSGDLSQDLLRDPVADQRPSLADVDAAVIARAEK